MANAEAATASDLPDLTTVAEPPDPAPVRLGPAELMASTHDLWSNIPPELAGLFLGHLHAHADRVRFAAVCPQWCSAARHVCLPPPLPLLALKDKDTFYGMPQGEPLHFGGCKNGFATTCGKWLVYGRFRELVLVDPFSGATMTLPSPLRIYLPEEKEDGCVGCTRDSDDSACKLEGSKDGHDSALVGDDSGDGSTQSRVHLPNKDGAGDSRDDHHDSTEDGEDSKGNHDSADEGDYYVDGFAYSDEEELLEDLKWFQVIKLMECSPNLFVALFRCSELNRVAVCRPGGSKWSVAWGLSCGPADMAFYQGKLYVVDYYEDLYAVDINVDDKTGDPQVSWIGEVINVKRLANDQTLLMLYLVESCGSLLMVRRRIFDQQFHGEGKIHTFAGQCEPDVLIFEADFGRSQWVKVKTLANDQTLFLGPCSRAVCMPQGDSPGNRVWFLDDYKDFHIWDDDENYSSSDGTSGVANTKPSSPLPMISWMGYQGTAGAAWLFPPN